MARGLNNVQLIGNLGRDPEVKYTPGGVACCQLQLATNESYKDKSGEWKETVEWHTVVFWKTQAENLAKMTKKGSRIFVCGKIRTESWEDKTSGEKRYKTKIQAKEFLLLDAKKDGQPDNFDSAAPSGEITDEDIPF